MKKRRHSLFQTNYFPRCCSVYCYGRRGKIYEPSKVDASAMNEISVNVLLMYNNFADDSTFTYLTEQSKHSYFCTKLTDTIITTKYYIKVNSGGVKSKEIGIIAALWHLSDIKYIQCFKYWTVTVLDVQNVFPFISYENSCILCVLYTLNWNEHSSFSSI